MQATTSRNDDLFSFDPTLRTPLVVSVGFHLLIIIAFTVGLPIVNPPPEIYTPISVELVEIDKITQTNKVAAPKKVVEEKPEQTPPENKLQPPEMKEEPKPQEIEEPKPPEPEKIEQEVPKPEPKKEEPKPEEKPKEKPKPPEPKKEEPKEEPKQEEDFQSLLKNLSPAEPEQTEEVAEEAPEETTPEQSALANLSDRLTMSQEDALRRQLGQCWNVPAGAAYAEELVVEMRVTVNPDRTVQQATIIDQGRYNRDAIFRAAADAARRAFQNPRCIPLELPPEGYQQWKSMVIRFDPREML